MTTQEKKDHQSGAVSRPLAAVGTILLALLLGLLLAPPVFNGVLRLGRAYPACTFLREYGFTSIAGRAVLICLLFALYPALRLAGIRTRRDLGFPSDGRGKRLFLTGLMVGLLSLGMVFFVGWLMDAYIFAVEEKIRRVSKVVLILVGAVLTGYIEEILFRGFFFGAIRRTRGFWFAAMISSLFFMAVHFASPYPFVETVYGHWYSGLRHLPEAFYGGHDLYHYFPFMLTLLLMGLGLCAFYEAFGHLSLVAGLHAGWIILMRMGGYLCNRDRDVAPFWFGQSEVVSKCWATCLMAAVFLGVGLWFRHHRASRPEERA